MTNHNDKGKFGVGEAVQLTGDKEHYNLGKEWEILTKTKAGYILTDGEGIDTVTVNPSEISHK